jgi:hypothetical protein
MVHQPGRALLLKPTRPGIVLGVPRLPPANDGVVAQIPSVPQQDGLFLDKLEHGRWIAG